MLKKGTQRKAINHSSSQLRNQTPLEHSCTKGPKSEWYATLNTYIYVRSCEHDKYNKTTSDELFRQKSFACGLDGYRLNIEVLASDVWCFRVIRERQIHFRRHHQTPHICNLGWSWVFSEGVISPCCQFIKPRMMRQALHVLILDG